MIKFMNVLFLAALLMFVFGAYLATRCIYSQTELQLSDLAVMFGGAIAGLIAYFIRLKIKEGLPIFKLTQKDRKEVEDFRTELSPRSLLSRLLIYVGVLLVFAGCASLFHNLFLESNKLEAALAKILVIVSGATCILLAIVISKGR